MKEYIILFQKIRPELISALNPKEALKFLAIDDLNISLQDWNNFYNNKSILEIINKLNENLEEENKIGAIYRLKGFRAIANL